MDAKEAKSRLESARGWQRNCENHVQRCVDENYKASRAGQTHERRKRMLAKYGDDYKQVCWDNLKHAKAELKDAKAKERKAEDECRALDVDPDLV